MAKGGFRGGYPGGQMNMMKQAQKMQQEFLKMQQELEAAKYEFTAGGGAVNLKIDGTLRVTEIKIEPEIIDPDEPETLEDTLVAAVNEGIKRVQDASANEMSALAAKYGIPDGAF